MSAWEERWHPLREEWVVVAAHRQNRPWSGEQVHSGAPASPSYMKDCFLCPGNLRVSGQQNDAYLDVFVFDNDHPCVAPFAPEVSTAPSDGSGVHRARAARGSAKVVCYSPRHDLTLAELSPDEIVVLLRAWQVEYRKLGALPEVEHVLVFENKGEVVGVSNPHPHCQIYATNFVFKTIEIEVQAARRHFDHTGRVLFQDLIAAELADGRRVIAENRAAIAFLPYFARYAYETYVAPKRSYPSLADVPEAELLDFALVLQEVLVRFDNLWRMEFPYVMVLHQAPTDGGNHQSFHFHVEFHPPLRKPNLLKYLAGPEIGGGNFLSDTCPEDKAAELRAVPSLHYKKCRP